MSHNSLCSSYMRPPSFGSSLETGRIRDITRLGPITSGVTRGSGLSSDSVGEPVREPGRSDGEVVVAAVERAGAVVDVDRDVVDGEGLDEALSTLDVHDDVVGPVHDVDRHVDLVRDPVQRERGQLLPSLGVVLGAGEPLQLLLQRRVPLVEVGQDAPRTAPGGNRLDARFEGGSTRGVVPPEADPRKADAVCVDVTTLLEEVE